MIRLTPVIILLAIGMIGCRNKLNTLHDRLNKYYYDMGYYLDYYGKKDSAFYFFNKVVATATDSLQKGKAYNHMAAIQYDAGDYFGAQESLLASIASLDPTNPRHDSCLFSDYTMLGNISNEFKNPDEAIRHYDKAASFTHMRDYVLNLANGKAVALQKKGEYEAAFRLMDSALLQKPADNVILARIISNQARARWLLNPGFNPVNDFHRALSMRLDVGDSAGVTTSYAHLADYYGDFDADSSRIYARKMYETATQLNNADDRLEALVKLIKQSPTGELKQLFETFYIVDSSLKTARNAAKNQFALIRYDAEKAKSDNLVLQQNITRQRLLLYVILSLAIVTVLMVWMAYRRKRRRMQQQAETAIRENKLKTSQKVHDVVANGLYRIMNDLEHKPVIDKEEILDRVETLYEKSRDISYDGPEETIDTARGQSLSAMLSSFGSPSRKILLVGDVEGCLEKLSPRVQAELRQVLQELMINMKKHSHAENVVVKFKTEANAVLIGYRDDGVGLPTSDVQGNGLRSTVNRIIAIGGSINFDRTGNKGAKIDVTLPVENHQHD